MEIDNESLKNYVSARLYLDQKSLAQDLSEVYIEDLLSMDNLVAKLKKFIADYEIYRKVKNARLKE